MPTMSAIHVTKDSSVVLETYITESIKQIRLSSVQCEVKLTMYCFFALSYGKNLTQIFLFPVAEMLYLNEL